MQSAWLLSRAVNPMIVGVPRSCIRRVRSWLIIYPRWWRFWPHYDHLTWRHAWNPTDSMQEWERNEII
jgi:hypothetical protein